MHTEICKTYQGAKRLSDCRCTANAESANFEIYVCRRRVEKMGVQRNRVLSPRPRTSSKVKNRTAHTRKARTDKSHPQTTDPPPPQPPTLTRLLSDPVMRPKPQTKTAELSSGIRSQFGNPQLGGWKKKMGGCNSGAKKESKTLKKGGQTNEVRGENNYNQKDSLVAQKWELRIWFHSRNVGYVWFCSRTKGKAEVRERKKQPRSTIYIRTRHRRSGFRRRSARLAPMSAPVPSVA